MPNKFIEFIHHMHTCICTCRSVFGPDISRLIIEMLACKLTYECTLHDMISDKLSTARHLFHIDNRLFGRYNRKMTIVRDLFIREQIFRKLFLGNRPSFAQIVNYSRGESINITFNGTIMTLIFKDQYAAGYSWIDHGEL